MTIDNSQSFISHLIELRKRLLTCLITFLIFFLLLIYFSNDIYTLMAKPLTKYLPLGAHMIATGVAAPFSVPIKLVMMISILISVPIILYQVWAFIAPALYKNEQRLIVPLLISSTILFYIGVIFSYFVVLPLMFEFFTKSAPEGVLIATDINNYFDFIMTLFIAFGISFEVPVAIILLCWCGVTTPDTLKKKRPYILVIAFIAGMLLTPPDVFSQTLLAIPIYLLFEIGLFFAKFCANKKSYL